MIPTQYLVGFLYKRRVSKYITDGLLLVTVNMDKIKLSQVRNFSVGESPCD